MRSHAVFWDSHELGDPANWPAALHAALAIVSAAPGPMQLWWGSEAFVFANSAATALLGGPPNGRRARDVYAARWNTLAPALESVRRDRVPVTIDGVTLTPLPGVDGVDGVICVPTGAADTPANALWIAHGEQAPRELTGDTPRDAEVPAKARRRRVLLIEDNDQTACALKVALEQLGYTVAIAHDGPVALDVASTFDPDVALVDIGLPVMDGWELAARLRERVSHHALHFLAVTARDRPADKDRSMASGFAEHLVKPIDVESLHRAIERLPERS